MNEEEKGAIEQIKSWKDYVSINKEKVNKAEILEKILEIVLTLIEKRQDRINKTIEYIESQEFEHDLDIDYERCKNELLKVLKGE